MNAPGTLSRRSKPPESAKSIRAALVGLWASLKTVSSSQFRPRPVSRTYRRKPSRYRTSTSSTSTATTRRSGTRGDTGPARGLARELRAGDDDGLARELGAGDGDAVV